MKNSLGKKTILLTHPVLVIGSYDETGRPNLMTASWGGICCSEPPCIAISIRKSRLSYKNILHNEAFTVNIPSVKYLKETDFIGTQSGKNYDKFDICKLTPVKAEIVNAPYIQEFHLVLICKLIHTTELGIHTQFIGEIVESLVDDEYTNEKGLPSIEKIQPFIYDTSVSAYYAIGNKIMDAFITKEFSK
ncbi:MAG: flavin reductase family protein [FCB group bacterium]|jgi:flavin reductase (DIM6/NTAB) family NADH-FMN oxidoreductase RutF